VLIREQNDKWVCRAKHSKTEMKQRLTHKKLGVVLYYFKYLTSILTLVGNKLPMRMNFYFILHLYDIPWPAVYEIPSCSGGEATGSFIETQNLYSQMELPKRRTAFFAGQGKFFQKSLVDFKKI